MKLKSYFSATVEAAVDQARQELGEDALLINARPSTPDTRHLGAYEVVFGLTGAPPAPPMLARGSRFGAAKVDARVPALADRTSTNGTGSGASGDTLARDVAQMRREIERLATTLRGASVLSSAADAPVSEIYTRLIDNELDPAIAQSVAEGAPLAQYFEVDATLGRKGAERAIVALVGPPGAGKTTTLVKLAARYGLASRKPAQIVTADVFRIAAADQLRSLASILGIGCDVAETAVALAQIIEEHRTKHFVFIDTPGLAGCEMEDGADLAALIAAHPEIDTHLVVPASMRPSDLARTIDRYSVFQPKKLLFTRLDETDCYGALITEAAHRGLPVSFLATGQQIPDDLEPATKQRLTDLVMGTEIDPGSDATRDAIRRLQESDGDAAGRKAGAAA